MPTPTISPISPDNQIGGCFPPTCRVTTLDSATSNHHASICSDRLCRARSDWGVCCRRFPVCRFRDSVTWVRASLVSVQVLVIKSFRLSAAWRLPLTSTPSARPAWRPRRSHSPPPPSPCRGLRRRRTTSPTPGTAPWCRRACDAPSNTLTAPLLALCLPGKRRHRHRCCHRRIWRGR